MQPWDEQVLRQQVLDWAEVVERRRADALSVADEPGAYLVFAGDHRLVDTLGVYATGRAVLYAGSANALRSRVGRHQKTIRDAHHLRAEGMWFALLPTASAAGAALVEAILINELRPPWNDRACAGFGNQHPGFGRLATARTSPWDAAFAGRSWIGAVDRCDRIRSRLRLNQLLVDCDRHRLLWEPLID